MIRYVAAALAALFSLQTSAAVFLKAAAEGEVRAVQNGESWATAYTNAQDALTAALARLSPCAMTEPRHARARVDGIFRPGKHCHLMES